MMRTNQLTAELTDIDYYEWTEPYRAVLRKMIEVRSENRRIFLNRQQPTDFDQQIILIVSPPRSSSTRTHRVLSSDPQFQFISLQKCIYPFSNEKIEWLLDWYGKQQQLHVLDADVAAEWSWLISTLGQCNFPYGGRPEEPADDDTLLLEMKSLLSMMGLDNRPLVMKDTSRIHGEWLTKFTSHFPNTKTIFLLRKDQAARRLSCEWQSHKYFANTVVGFSDPEPTLFPNTHDRNVHFIEDWQSTGLLTESNLFWKEDLTEHPETILDVYKAIGYECPQSVLNMAIKNEKF